MTNPKEATREALPEQLKVVAWIPRHALHHLAERARKSVAVYPEKDNEGESALVLLTDAQSALESERQAHAAEVERLRLKAARYDWLRESDWFDSELCVLRDPKRVLTKGVGLGADCPSRDRLDAAIDQAIAREKT